MKTINWGIIGAGTISTRFAKVLAGAEGMAVRAVYNRHVERAEALAGNFPGCLAFDKLEDLLATEGIDAVYIGVTNDVHLPIAKQCMKAGKAVLCEKPMAMTAADAREMIICARDSKVLLMEAMWTRFLPAYRQVKRWVDEGRIGKVRLIEASFCFRGPNDPEHRLYNKALGGGALYDIGVYCVEYITGLLGRPDRVTGALHMGPTQVDEISVVNLIYDDGAIGTATSSIVYDAPERVNIFGEKGSIRIPSDFFRADKALLHAEDGTLLEEFNEGSPDNFIYQIDHFGGLIREGKKESDIMPLSDTLDCAEIFDEVLGAAADGRGKQ